MADDIIDSILAEEQMVTNNIVAATKQVAEEGGSVMKEVTENAKEFAEAAQVKVEEAAKYTINAISSVKTIIKDVASMKTDELEVYLKDNAQSLWEKIKVQIEERRNDLNESKVFFPELDKKSKKFDNILNTFSEILDEDELNGWGKFKEIVKELIKWIVRIFLKIGQILLKIAVTVVIGAVKIAAVTIDTTFGVAGILHKEVVKPTVKSAKSAYANHKERKAEKDAEFDEFDEMVEETAREMA